MPQVTLRDLNEWIDIGTVQDEARKKFEAQQRAKRGLNDWLVSLMPVFMLFAFIAFYLLSAPHTVTLLNRITPGWGWVSPIGLEMFVVVVAAARQLKWRTYENGFILLLLLLMTIAINVAGGFIAVLATDNNPRPFQDMLSTFTILSAEQQIVLILVVPIGILIPLMGKFAGEIVIKIATGEIKFESVNIEDLWIRERASVMKSALIRAAIKKGAGTRTAGSWSQKIIEEMYEDDVMTQATSSHAVETGRTAELARAEMGFAGMVGQLRDSPRSPTNLNVRENTSHNSGHSPQMDTSEMQDTGTRGTVMRAALVTQWVKDNPEKLQVMLSRPGARRDVSRAISREIAGNDAGYKTVERVLKAMNIEF